MAVAAPARTPRQGPSLSRIVGAERRPTGLDVLRRLPGSVPTPALSGGLRPAVLLEDLHAADAHR